MIFLSILGPMFNKMALCSVGHEVDFDENFTNNSIFYKASNVKRKGHLALLYPRRIQVSSFEV